LDLGDHAAAARAGADLPRLFPDRQEAHDRAALQLARCVPVADRDTRLDEGKRKEVAAGYAAQARRLLREAITRCDDPLKQAGRLWFAVVEPDPRLLDTAFALDLAKQAVGRDPRAFRLWRTLGAAHYRAGDWAEAVKALQKSLELREGGTAAGSFLLAMAHHRLKDEKAARKWYAHAVAQAERDRREAEELRSLRTEAAALLGIPEAPRPKGEAVPGK